MHNHYVRSLGPRLVRYFDRLARSDAVLWSEHQRLAQRFADLVAGEEEAWQNGAQRLLSDAERVRGEAGTAWQEMMLALRVLIRGKGDISEADVERYQLIWKSLGGGVPLSEIISWGTPEDAVVEADRRLQAADRKHDDSSPNERTNERGRGEAG